MRGAMRFPAFFVVLSLMKYASLSIRAVFLEKFSINIVIFSKKFIR